MSAATGTGALSVSASGALSITCYLPRSRHRRTLSRMLRLQEYVSAVAREQGISQDMVVLLALEDFLTLTAGLPHWPAAKEF